MYTSKQHMGTWGEIFLPSPHQARGNGLCIGDQCGHLRGWNPPERQNQAKGQQCSQSVVESSNYCSLPGEDCGPWIHAFYRSTDHTIHHPRTFVVSWKESTWTLVPWCSRDGRVSPSIDLICILQGCCCIINFPWPQRFHPFSLN